MCLFVFLHSVCDSGHAYISNACLCIGLLVCICTIIMQSGCLSDYIHHSRQSRLCVCLSMNISVCLRVCLCNSRPYVYMSFCWSALPANTRLMSTAIPMKGNWNRLKPRFSENTSMSHCAMRSDAADDTPELNQLRRNGRRIRFVSLSDIIPKINIVYFVCRLAEIPELF